MFCSLTESRLISRLHTTALCSHFSRAICINSLTASSVFDWSNSSISLNNHSKTLLKATNDLHCTYIWSTSQLLHGLNALLRSPLTYKYKKIKIIHTWNQKGTTFTQCLYFHIKNIILGLYYLTEINQRAQKRSHGCQSHIVIVLPGWSSRCQCDTLSRAWHSCLRALQKPGTDIPPEAGKRVTQGISANFWCQKNPKTNFPTEVHSEIQTFFPSQIHNILGSFRQFLHTELIEKIRFFKFLFIPSWYSVCMLWGPKTNPSSHAVGPKQTPVRMLWWQKAPVMHGSLH